MDDSRRGAQGVVRLLSLVSRRASIFAILIVGTIGTAAQTTDQTPPSAPIGLTATASSCGQVDLSWSASTDTGGSGLKAYVIQRSDWIKTSIGAARTTFSDTNYVKSSSTLTYTVIAQDNAGNKSAASNSVTVTTPPCPTSIGERVVDEASIEPLGKSATAYGSLTALIYAKQNLSSTLDTWLYLSDSATGQNSKFMLHTSPGYRQIESDYVLTSGTELWTLSYLPDGGNVLVSQYRLDGSPIPTSATLVSTQPLGDSQSHAKALIRLKSGGLVAAWNQEGWGYFESDNSVHMGFAYRSPSGAWSVQFPIVIAPSAVGNATNSQTAMVQHPGDGSIWAFSKRDSFEEMIAVHFTEASGNLVLDWTKNDYISSAADGSNGPQSEFPFLNAVADPTRNAILLSYQTNQYRMVFIDPLYFDMNGIFLKDATATVAQISADGSKAFIPFPTYLERGVQFAMSVLADGTIWLTYQPINGQTLTWNEVYSSQYSGNNWSTPSLVSFNYNNYNQPSGLRDPGYIIGNADQAQVAFLAPDQKVHTFALTNLGPAPPDTTPPAASITSPAIGATVSGTLSVLATASDNVGITGVQLLVDGTAVGSGSAPPYNFSWNTTTLANGIHALQIRAYDAAGNTGLSQLVSVNVSNQTSSSPSNLSVAILNPANGSSVPRNQKVTVSATATDTIAVTKVEFYINNSLLGASTTAPYAYPWKVPAKRGQYKIQAKAYDAAGKSAAQAITVTAQ